MTWWNIQVSPLKSLFSERDLWSRLLLCWALSDDLPGVFPVLCLQAWQLSTLPFNYSRQLKLPDVEWRARLRKSVKWVITTVTSAILISAGGFFSRECPPDFLFHNGVMVHQYWLILTQNDCGWVVVAEELSVNSSLKCFEIIIRKLSSTMHGLLTVGYCQSFWGEGDLSRVEFGSKVVDPSSSVEEETTTQVTYLRLRAL